LTFDRLIEIRPILEKRKLKRTIKDLGEKFQLHHVHRVPHLTLVYNFRPRASEFELMKRVREVAKGFRSLTFEYDGWQLKESPTGHVLAFRVRPSPELKDFRAEMYAAIRGKIESAPRRQHFNEATRDDFWFHAAVAFRMGPSETARLEPEVERLRQLYLPSEIWRIPLLGNGRIVYEYDTLQDAILNRSQALSKYSLSQDLAIYRKRNHIETSPPGYSTDSSPRIWLISDTHFGHGNIIGHCARPFLEANEMDRILVNNWNNTVGPKDTVFCLGDVVWNGFPPRDAADGAIKAWHERALLRTQEFVRRLNGRKVFVIGNHDPAGLGEEGGFLEHGGIRFELKHDPKDRSDPSAWLIHGDKHNNNLRLFPFISQGNRTVNVCAELVRYSPVDIDMIVQLISEGRDFATLPEIEVGTRPREVAHEPSQSKLAAPTAWWPRTAPHRSSRIVRRRGTAIVDTPEGILVVAGKRGVFLLPGGGAGRHESRMNATIRELHEETGLVTRHCRYLFSHDDPEDGRKIRNLHKVFLVDAVGRPRHTSHESRHIGYWKPGSNLHLSRTTKLLIERYLDWKRTRK
jgi:calcineurin-like phosphoesterase family protein/ADP-ribose pyrophosphatase YjhB (NUDIX family)